MGCLNLIGLYDVIISSDPSFEEFVFVFAVFVYVIVSYMQQRERRKLGSAIFHFLLLLCYFFFADFENNFL